MKQSHIEPLESRIAPAGLSIADAQVSEGDSGTKNLDFTVTLTGAITSNVTATYATVDSTGTVADGDYFATSGTLTFTPGGPTTKTISVRVHGDTKIESNETFFVNLGTVTGATKDDAQAIGTILNEDPNLRITDVTVTEGDAGSQTAVFVVSLSANPNKTVKVDFTTVDGTAVDGVGDPVAADYLRTSGTLTFPAGTLTKTIPVTILGDRIKELSQNTFSVVLSNARTDPDMLPLTLADATGVGTILDNNDAAPTVSIDDKVVFENVAGGKANFTVKLTQISDLPVTVDYTTVNGTGTQGALGGADFTAQTSTLTIAPGQLSNVIAVAVTNDTTVEPDETFSVRLSNAKLNLPTPLALTLTKATGAGTILNDDVTVSLAAGTAAENVVGGKLNFVVNLSQAAAADVVLRYSTSDGTAKAPGDYTAAVNATLTIPKGQTTGTISIPIINDTLNELTETFNVTLTGVTHAALGTPITAVGTITDNDAAPLVSIGNTTTIEGTGANSNAVFTVTLSAISGKEVKVKYATANGTALAGTDYTAPAATAELIIPAGQKTGTVSIPVLGDSIDEDAETFTLTLNTPTNATLGSPTTGTATIQDDDAQPTLTIDDVAVAENAGNGVFNVRLTGSTARTVTVAFATEDNGAVAGSDYTAKTGTVTFLPERPNPADAAHPFPAETIKQISIPILNDAVSETNEQFFVNLSSATNAIINDGRGIGTILNDDATFKIVSFTDGSSTVTAAEEGAGGAAQVVKFKVILENGAPGATTTVNFATVDATAKSSGLRPDFTAQNGTLVFSGAVTEQVISIPITADSNYENNETFSVELSNPVNAVLKAGLGTGLVTITDNDPKPTLNIDDVSILEGNSGTKTLSFKVSLSAANEKDTDVQVSYLTADGTGPGGAISVAPKADFTAVTTAKMLTFNKGDVQMAIDIPIIGDTRDEDNQTFKVNLSALSAGAIAGKLVGTGTILDDDAAPFVSIGNLTLGENDNGLPNKVFTVKLVNAANQAVESERTITVNYQTANGTATAPGDYTTTAGQLTFAPGTMQQTISVPLVDDLLNEPDETFQVNLLASPTNATLGVAHGVGTIQDNDTPPAIAINDVTFVEGDSGTTNAVFTVSLTQASAQTVKVNFATADGTAKATGPFADYLPTTGTLTFAPGGPLTQTVSVPVIGDTFLEADEQFVVNLTEPVNATLTDHASGAAIIQNGADTLLGLVLMDTQIVEGDSGTSTAQFTALLSGPASSNVTFTLSTLNGTAVGGSAADTGADFEAAVKTGTISANTSSTNVAINIKGDGVFEATESFFLNLTGASPNVQVVDDNAFAGAQATARAYIFNDDFNVLGPGKLQWIDVDGDLVTLTVSKGALNFNLGSGDDLFFNTPNAIGGRQLQLLNFTNDGIAFAAANLSIIATKQAGFPLPTDGRVDVGEIRAAVFLTNELQAIGNDLGVVKVDGDLAKISAGDPFSTPAIVKLDVYSLGARGTSTLVQDPNIAEQNTLSKVLGPITTLNVKQNVLGSVFVIGAEFGVVTTLNIGGALQGGAGASSGQVVVTGHIGTATIGSIIGGAGVESGLLAANGLTQGRIGNVKVTGAIVGGTAAGSGQIFGTKIGNVSAAEILGGSGVQSGAIIATSTLGSVTLAGDLRGGPGASSGAIFANGGVGAVKIDGSIIGGPQQNSGSLISNAGIVSLALTGTVRGGAGQTSGSVQANGGGIGAITIGEDTGGDSIVGGAGLGSGSIGVALSIASLSTAGNIRGGSADNSGAITVNGSIDKLFVGRSLIGGTAHGPATDGSPAVALANSGYLKANRFKSATINEDIMAGVDGGAGIANSGAIRADVIDALSVRDLLGSAAVPVVISAAGLSSQAMKSVLVRGNVQFAEILAGYDVDGSPTNFRGTPLNADASIGTVSILGSVQGLNLVAGAQPGADGRFGTADDRLIVGGVALPSGFQTKDAPNLISQIASVIINGAIVNNSASYGVIAQHILSLKTGANGIPLGLQTGPGNDVATAATDPDPGVEISPGSKFRALELPL